MLLGGYAPVAAGSTASSPELSPVLTPQQLREPTHKTPLKAAVGQSAGATTAPPCSRSRRARKWQALKRVFAALGVVALLALAGVMMLRFIKTKEFNAIILWIQHHQVLGSVTFVLSFTIFIILCFPSTAFELIAGYIFGFWLGFLLATIGKLLGSVLAFMIGRYLCRRRVREYMERGHPVFKAFQSLLRKRQVLIVFLTRTAFFPIAMKNYGLSVLDVKFAVYFAAALLTGIPFSVIWVYSGNAAQHLTTLLSEKDSSNNRTEAVLLVIGACSALALLAFIGFYTRQQIMAMAEDEKNQAAEVSTKQLPLRPSRTS
ncbi:hypothetical protein ATCC90586_004565 [Pythium insidiosum]|nr:hypothetical protein ATCC90586_004565 [Pythium insidiosum]